MRATDLLELRPEGLWCPPAGIYIDPARPVARAVITHGHADHCRPGTTAILASPETAAIARLRYGATAFETVEPLGWNEPLQVGDARIRLVPAGHVLGSAQVVIEAGGARAVVSGDYKRMADPTCAPFEPVECDLFVTEATFALPVFRHPPAEAEIAKLLASLEARPERCHAVSAYSLGKAQRLIALLRAAGYDAPIHLHGALREMCGLYEALGVPLGRLEPIPAEGGEGLRGGVALVPPAALSERWARRLPEPLICAASGWMQLRQRARRAGVELPLILSDHADWDDLCSTILETRAESVWVTHGAEEALCHWCGLRGIAARPLSAPGRGEESGED